MKIKNPRESQIKSKSTNSIKYIHLTIKLNNQTCNNFKQSQQIQARQNLKEGPNFLKFGKRLQLQDRANLRRRDCVSIEARDS